MRGLCASSNVKRVTTLVEESNTKPFSVVFPPLPTPRSPNKERYVNSIFRLTAVFELSHRCAAGPAGGKGCKSPTVNEWRIQSARAVRCRSRGRRRSLALCHFEGARAAFVVLSAK
ncbi:hypothetical protein SBBP2_2800004 [Burkholderiales bacterium]|nr:hypothetical protein SBBP2_2800004 [Burkholderiales bacterium]